jgi:hypothetical protein
MTGASMRLHVTKYYIYVLRADTDPSDNIRLFILGSECGL